MTAKGQTGTTQQHASESASNWLRDIGLAFAGLDAPAPLTPSADEGQHVLDHVGIVHDVGVPGLGVPARLPGLAPDDAKALAAGFAGPPATLLTDH